MKVEVLRGFCVEAGRDVFPGDVIDLPNTRALVEIQRGRAQPLGPVSNRQIENRDPVGKATRG